MQQMQMHHQPIAGNPFPPAPQRLLRQQQQQQQQQLVD
jgi:hypothetical protein